MIIARISASAIININIHSSYFEMAMPNITVATASIII